MVNNTGTRCLFLDLIGLKEHKSIEILENLALFDCCIYKMPILPDTGTLKCYGIPSVKSAIFVPFRTEQQEFLQLYIKIAKGKPSGIKDPQ